MCVVTIWRFTLIYVESVACNVHKKLFQYFETSRTRSIIIFHLILLTPNYQWNLKRAHTATRRWEKTTTTKEFPHDQTFPRVGWENRKSIRHEPLVESLYRRAPAFVWRENFPSFSARSLPSTHTLWWKWRGWNEWTKRPDWLDENIRAKNPVTSSSIPMYAW